MKVAPGTVVIELDADEVTTLRGLLNDQLKTGPAEYNGFAYELFVALNGRAD